MSTTPPAAGDRDRRAAAWFADRSVRTKILAADRGLRAERGRASGAYALVTLRAIAAQTRDAVDRGRRTIMAPLRHGPPGPAQGAHDRRAARRRRRSPTSPGALARGADRRTTPRWTRRSRRRGRRRRAVRAPGATFRTAFDAWRTVRDDELVPAAHRAMTSRGTSRCSTRSPSPLKSDRTSTTSTRRPRRSTPYAQDIADDGRRRRRRRAGGDPDRRARWSRSSASPRSASLVAAVHPPVGAAGAGGARGAWPPGDLTARADVRSRDEVGRMAAALDDRAGRRCGRRSSGVVETAQTVAAAAGGAVGVVQPGGGRVGGDDARRRGWWRRRRSRCRATCRRWRRARSRWGPRSGRSRRTRTRRRRWPVRRRRSAESANEQVARLGDVVARRSATWSR